MPGAVLFDNDLVSMPEGLVSDNDADQAGKVVALAVEVEEITFAAQIAPGGADRIGAGRLVCAGWLTAPDGRCACVLAVEHRIHQSCEVKRIMIRIAGLKQVLGFSAMPYPTVVITELKNLSVERHRRDVKVLPLVLVVLQQKTDEVSIAIPIVQNNDGPFIRDGKLVEHFGDTPKADM